MSGIDAVLVWAIWLAQRSSAKNITSDTVCCSVHLQVQEVGFAHEARAHSNSRAGRCMFYSHTHAQCDKGRCSSDVARTGHVDARSTQCVHIPFAHSIYSKLFRTGWPLAGAWL